jgi:hypothetical protein
LGISDGPNIPPTASFWSDLFRVPSNRHRKYRADVQLSWSTQDEDFDVEVRNKNLDRTCLLDELSGGQFVLVNEAVNLGIVTYNMRQGEGIRCETLVRGETVGALEAANGNHLSQLRAVAAQELCEAFFKFGEGPLFSLNQSGLIDGIMMGR